MESVIKIFTAATFNGCYILQDIASTNPALETSKFAVDRTIENEKRKHRIYDGKEALPAGQKKSLQYVKTQRIIWKEGEELEWPGVIAGSCGVPGFLNFKLDCQPDDLLRKHSPEKLEDTRRAGKKRNGARVLVAEE